MKEHICYLAFLLVCIKLFSQTINAPIDYKNPDKGYFKLEYEFGNSYNPELPTVMVIADAQQFYVREGRIKKIQEDLFGDGFNVLGIIPRGTNEELRIKANLNEDNQTDWKQAYNIFKAYQYANDIELIRTKVLSNDNEVYLYGQSGGALLITEYLSLFPEAKIKKVFIGASVNSVVEAQLGIVHDNFQSNYLSKNKPYEVKLDRVLEEGIFDRELVASLFQRQNFFVELAELNHKRSELIDRLYLKDTPYINKLRKEYQVDAINNLLKSEIGTPIRVRLFEFIQPLLSSFKKDDKFYPDIENGYNIAKPIIDILSEIDAQPAFNEAGLRKFKGDVFILSGRYDHVADYRSSIYLSGLLEKSTLFIVNDDHTFKSLKANGDYAKLIQDFLNSSHKNDLNLKYKKYQWNEQ